MIEKTALPYRRRPLNKEEKKLIEQVGVTATGKRKGGPPKKGSRVSKVKGRKVVPPYTGREYTEKEKVLISSLPDKVELITGL